MPTPAPPRAAGPSAATITVRVLITVLVLLSLGFLAWVAMLRIAIMRRSGRDWALFWAQLILNIACLVPLEQHFAGTWMNTAGMVVLLVQMALVTCYFLVVDIRHHQPAPVVVMVPSAGAPPYPYAAPGYGHGYPPGASAITVPGSIPHPNPHPNPYASAPPPPVQAPAGSAPRIDQVRAELDELSDLLRGDDSGEGEGGR
ncbi:hypothetical protein [Streptomyces vietnamensis]|uniref:hypothetical protein n=1 Tax=Streptomyces vietnamensis TaxID=362257 RepID=UPI00131CC76E|nr:hypothetical protein [Streptomyces vietnamensis]